MFGVFHLLLDLIVILARCLRPGGRSALIAEHLLVRQQLIAIRRKRKKAPRLTRLDRVVFAVSSLFIRSRRLPRLSIVVAHSTLLGFHKALVNRKYSKLFSNKERRRPGPKGPSAELIRLVVDIKLKNPRYGYPKITLLVSKLLDGEISEQQVRRILRKHFRNLPPGSGPSWLNAIGHAKDALWSMDLFCSESILLRTHWVKVVMGHFTRGKQDFEFSTSVKLRPYPRFCGRTRLSSEGSERFEGNFLMRRSFGVSEISKRNLIHFSSITTRLVFTHPFLA